jgi:hypothetical protein
VSPLLVKELRSLRPYFAFAVVLLGVSVLGDLVSRSGPASLASTFREVAAMPLPLFFGLIALGLGTGLSVKEHDEGTLAFLDALPLSRTRVFFTKLVASMLVLALFPALQLGWVVLNHALARGSLDEAFRPGLLLGAFLGQMVLCFSFLSVGTLLGFARSLTWLLVGLSAIGLQRLTHVFPRAAALDPLKLVEAGAVGVRWQYDAEAFAVQGLVSAVCLSASWALFTRAGRGRTVLVNPRPVVAALVSLGTFAAVVGALVLWAQETAPRPSSDGPDLTSLPPSAPASTRTAHYELSYPSLEAGRAVSLADQSDTVFEQVHALLGVDAGAPIVVDLSGSMRNTAGTAFAERLRMQLDDEAVATLAHETTHVVARRAVGEEGFERWSTARVLDEGLASWVEGHFKVMPEEETLVLAALLARHQLELNDLFDYPRFSAEHDDDLKYPIGRALIAATVARYGDGAVGRLLAAFADPTLSPTLSGATLWQTTFQQAGMDFPLVADDLFAGLAAKLDEDRATIEALPRGRARLVTKDGWYGVEVSVPEGNGSQWAVRFRPSPDSPLTEYDRVWVQNGEVAWREAGRIARQRVCFQVGLSLGGRALLYEPWACVPISAAAFLE